MSAQPSFFNGNGAAYWWGGKVINHGSYYTTKCGILGTLRSQHTHRRTEETTEFKVSKFKPNEFLLFLSFWPKIIILLTYKPMGHVENAIKR